MKMKKVPKCILPGELSNITVYYDVVDSLADVVCEEEATNIGELDPTCKMDPTEDSEPNQVPQEPSSHPDLVEVPENQTSSCDLESPMKELPEEQESCPQDMNKPTSPLRVESTPQRSSKDQGP